MATNVLASVAAAVALVKFCSCGGEAIVDDVEPPPPTPIVAGAEDWPPWEAIDQGVAARRARAAAVEALVARGIVEEVEEGRPLRVHSGTTWAAIDRREQVEAGRAVLLWVYARDRSVGLAVWLAPRSGRRVATYSWSHGLVVD